jgi:hypothetical protein
MAGPDPALQGLDPLVAHFGELDGQVKPVHDVVCEFQTCKKVAAEAATVWK